ncbi:curlin [Rhizobium rhizosphaerae]|uniref:Curlin n=1 Tax=Xaviernesmea rhizosphaerae TaxID=1672749 RepID=A0A1Q9AK27_9HYPH|nr:curlin [Xaviernesmea rhizosphaerae]OLP55628.1 curlin [Xaviernesmea rhizosphaerae]OQP86625.1 curlin [Xaviernesmea rhizosphaerae]
MTRALLTFATGALLAATMAMPVPALAGGQVSFNVAPANARDAELFSTGLRVYSLFRGIKNGEIRQSGSRNAAGLAQDGRGNLGVIRQHGNGNRGTLRQTGNDNAYGLFQYGRNNDDAIVQTGDNNSGATFSYGW